MPARVCMGIYGAPFRMKIPFKIICNHERILLDFQFSLTHVLMRLKMMLSSLHKVMIWLTKYVIWVIQLPTFYRHNLLLSIHATCYFFSTLQVTFNRYNLLLFSHLTCYFPSTQLISFHQHTLLLFIHVICCTL